MVDDANITLTSQRIICNSIREVFGKYDILPEGAVHNLGTGYMEADYGTYKYEKGLKNYCIQLFYGKADCLIALEVYQLMCKEAENI